MIEKKFRSLVQLFFAGSVNAIELSWLAEELRDRRDRRDLFLDLAQEFLEDRAADARHPDPFESLRKILIRDLSEVTEKDLRRAMPSNLSSVSSGEDAPAPRRSQPEVFHHKPLKPYPVATEPPGVFEEESSRSRTGVLVGLLIIAVVGFMVAYSSLDIGNTSSPKDEEAADPAEVKKLPQVSVIRQVNELIGTEDASQGWESFDQTASDLNGDPNIAPSPLRAEPLSLPDLLGSPQEGSSNVGSQATAGQFPVVFGN